jgi:hypothetical protein
MNDCTTEKPQKPNVSLPLLALIFYLKFSVMVENLKYIISVSEYDFLFNDLMCRLFGVVEISPLPYLVTFAHLSSL